MRRIPALTFALTAGLILGCAAELSGDLVVNDAPFQAVDCNSGQPLGFTGVQLADATGRRLRLVARPDGQSDAYYWPADASEADEVGICGPFTIATQNSEINGVKNVQGSATLDCSNGKHAIAGTITFANCH